jgi:hypothetical protein
MWRWAMMAALAVGGPAMAAAQNGPLQADDLDGYQVATDLAPNGGFEQVDAEGRPVGWWLGAGFEGVLGRDVFVGLSDRAHGGAHGLDLRVTTAAGSAIANSLPDPKPLDTLRGAAVLWYQAVASSVGGRNLSFSVIGIKADGLEAGRTTYVVPAADVGDGQWHRAVLEYDFSTSPTITRVTLAPRINETGVMGTGEIIFDDIAVHPRAVGLDLTAFSPSVPVAFPRDQFEIRCRIANNGGRPIAGGRVRLEVTGLTLAAGDRERPLPPLKPGETADEIAWRVHAPAQPVLATAKLEVRTDDAGTFRRSIEVPVSARPGPLPEPDADPAIERTDDALMLAFHRTRLVFPANPYGLGVTLVQVKSDDGWQQVAALPSLGEVVVATEEGEEVHDFYGESTLAIEGQMPTSLLRFAASATDGAGATWSLTVDFNTGFRVGEGVGYLFPGAALRHRLTVDRPSRLLAFRGPMVHVGEGGFGAQKDIAIFPGLEYLEGDERSSSTRDVHPPESLRLVPHPDKVTVPMMMVLRDPFTVALGWDPRQTWEGDRTRPAAMFCSPNWYQGQQDHLMSLFVPAPADLAHENQTQASRPIGLAPGQTIALTSELLAEHTPDGSKTMLPAYYYFARWGLPEIEQVRSYPEEIGLCLAAYAGSLWNEGRGWAPNQGWNDQAGYFAPVAELLQVALEAIARPQLIGEEQVPSADQRETVAHQVEQAVQRLGAREGMPLAFRLGDVGAALLWERNGALAALASQDDDGGWRFQPGDKQKDLGQPGDTTVGTCAGNAEALLRYARWSGDRRFLEAGLKALAFMDRFRVPAGAQVWECPLHAPDIYASARAVSAYLEAYQITGEAHYLERAQYWARTGLPFVYAWAAADRPIMTYATTPIFGASFYTVVWTGRPVQWCGLAYAQAVMRLAPYDRQFPWQELGEGITRTAMQMQAVEGERRGCYPDSYNLLTDTPAAPWLNPMLILGNVYRLLGVTVEPTTAIARREAGADWVPITALAQIENTALTNDALTATLTSERAGPVRLLIGGIARPEAVEVNGQPLAELPDEAGKAGDAAGWRYLPDLCALVVIAPQAATTELRVPNPRLAQPPGPALVTKPEWDFEAAGDAEGWVVRNDLGPPEVAGGAMTLHVTGADPFVAGPPMRVPADHYRTLVLRIKTEHGGPAQLFWTRVGQPQTSEELSRRFEVPAAPGGQVVRVPLGDDPAWTGIITGLRLDPPGLAGDSIAIDFLRLER